MGLACPSLVSAKAIASQPEAAVDTAAPLHCLGMGIVRGMDMARQLLFVLTPLSQTQLERVTRIQV